MKWGSSQLILNIIVLTSITPAIFPIILDFPARASLILANALRPFLGADIFFPPGRSTGGDTGSGAGMYILGAVKNLHYLIV